MVYAVCIAWHSMVYVLYIIVYISMSDMWWCVTEWSKAHLTHWQGNRAMTEPWASVYMILCQCARSEINLLSAVVCCYLLLSRICALFLCLLSVIWGVDFYCVAVNVLCCLCEDFCFLVLLCLVLCLVILLYYSNCIIIFLTIWYLLYIIICNTIQYRKNKAKRIMCVILLAFLY